MPYTPGDTVTVTDILTGVAISGLEVEPSPEGQMVITVLGTTLDLDALPQYMNVTDHKPGQPAPLPTEPGGYADTIGTPWVFDGFDWFVGSNDPNFGPVPIGPMTRLVPEPESVDRVIKWYEHAVEAPEVHAAARRDFGMEQVK